MHQSSHNHRCTRGYRRAAVGHNAGIRRRHFDHVVIHAQRLSCDLAENGIRALPKLRARHKNADATVRSRIYANQRIEVALARTCKPRAVKENSEPDTLLAQTVRVLAIEPRLLLVVPCIVQSALHPSRKVDLLANLLPRTCGLS